MTKAELNFLRCHWKAAVAVGPDIEVEAAFELDGDPQAALEWVLATRPLMPCVFAPTPYADYDTAGPCAGPLEAAHWIKRQTVERWVAAQLGVTTLRPPKLGSGRLSYDFDQERVDLVYLAAWDPRNGVPACQRHHRIFDSQRVPLPSEQIVVWRHQVPAHVEAFARDWGLEHELDRKHPTIGGGI